MQLDQAIPGQLVRLRLGRRFDTQLGVRERPQKFVADDKATDGRRAVAANVDGDGNERSPELFKVLAIARRGRGDNHIVIEGADLARGEVELDSLELAGPPPVDESSSAIDKDGQPSGALGLYVASAVQAEVAKAMAPLAGRLQQLQNDIDHVASDSKAAGIALAELAARVANLRAELAPSGPASAG